MNGIHSINSYGYENAYLRQASQNYSEACNIIPPQSYDSVLLCGGYMPFLPYQPPLGLIPSPFFMPMMPLMPMDAIIPISIFWQNTNRANYLLACAGIPFPFFGFFPIPSILPPLSAYFPQPQPIPSPPPPPSNNEQTCPPSTTGAVSAASAPAPTTKTESIKPQKIDEGSEPTTISIKSDSGAIEPDLMYLIDDIDIITSNENDVISQNPEKPSTLTKEQLEKALNDTIAQEIAKRAELEERRKQTSALRTSANTTEIDAKIKELEYIIRDTNGLVDAKESELWGLKAEWMMYPERADEFYNRISGVKMELDMRKRELAEKERQLKNLEAYKKEQEKIAQENYRKNNLEVSDIARLEQELAILEQQKEQLLRQIANLAG